MEPYSDVAELYTGRRMRTSVASLTPKLQAHQSHQPRRRWSHIRAAWKESGGEPTAFLSLLLAPSIVASVARASPLCGTHRPSSPSRQGNKRTQEELTVSNFQESRCLRISNCLLHWARWPSTSFSPLELTKRSPWGHGVLNRCERAMNPCH